MIDFEKIKAIAASETRKFDKPELTDDFIQFAAEALLRGRKATVGQLFIDFIRQEYGDSRHQTHWHFKFNNSVELEDGMEGHVVDQHDLDFTRIVDKFEGVDRSILILHYVWGMTLKEIGYAVNLSESAVSLRMTDINKRLVKRYGNA